jgi:D-beta-D-heptose 7-phosphate kinase/D-beta-D-heptose 1-phosphate adenosyltransferase
MNALSLPRLHRLLTRVRKTRVLVIGDVMLDQFIWGHVRRISPEAPVPVVDFDHESLMPGGAANVARNLTSLSARCELVGLVGRDDQGRTLKRLLRDDQVGCDAVLAHARRSTSVKTRIIAHQQQVVRVDRETAEDLDSKSTSRLLQQVEARLDTCSAVIVGDYGKGIVTQPLLDQVKRWCRARGLWLSLDPKPVHHLNLGGLSLITPNRKEAFELAGIPDGYKRGNPLEDARLLQAAETLLSKLQPAVLLITLGDQGMLLCCRDQQPFHIPTVAQEVYDVSGAGDTVIASFTLAIAAGASPPEAAIFSNHAAGVVVGKIGTAVVGPEELLRSFQRQR